MKEISSQEHQETVRKISLQETMPSTSNNIQ